MFKKEKLSFTGHDSFYCRSYWLKKGYDFVQKGEKFNDNAVIELGVGRNMVNAIRYWSRAFGLIDENEVAQPIAHALFDTKGFDPYCEDKATLWLLHYQLVTSRRASLYSIVFNTFRKEWIEFHKDRVVSYLKNYCNQQDVSIQESSLERDFDAFINNYLRKSSSRNIEDNLSGILQELNLVEKAGRIENKDGYKIESKDRDDLPALVVLFGIVKQLDKNTSIGFQTLLNGIDSVGSVFALTEHALMLKIESLLELYPETIIFTDDGGVRLLQFKQSFSESDILKKIYASESISVG
ncbi:MAG: hypothetical protein RLZZ292_4052 [Bacteroidota bacterium]|jgi:hypothetical protein